MTDVRVIKADRIVTKLTRADWYPGIHSYFYLIKFALRTVSANKLTAAANRHTTMCFNLRLFRWHTTSSVGRGWRVAWPGSAQRWHRAYRATPLGNIALRLSRLKNVIPTNAYPCKHSRAHTCVDSTTGIEQGQADQEHLDGFFGDQDKMFGPVYLPHYTRWCHGD